ncbi:MAG: NUDIX domain-containing protein [Paludibacter sp.]|jgi:ADP-ribose pyrophosphatase YjhB (NUDIX family)|nr:NUDIX domain-containing protein [Paludibacter sp.]
MTAENYYSSQDQHLVAVDCIILGFQENEIRLLAHPRAMEPARGGLSLMGGFVRKEESLDEAAIRVLTDLTGLENIYMEQVGMYGAVDRDPGRRVISCAYYALINIETSDQSLLARHNASWMNIHQAGQLIFDHEQMVSDALNILRRKASVEPIGLNFLPEKFTLTDLQSLYEAIYDQTLDKRNFRKRMLGFDFLEKLNEVDKSGSKKGAYYYKLKNG